MGFDFVEGGEEGCYCFFVGFLRCCEAGFVHAVVDVVVDPFVGGFDCGAVLFWVEVDFLVLLGQEVVEFVVEHSDYFGALGGFVSWSLIVRRVGSYLVADDPLCLLVEEDWDGKPARVVGVIGEVDLA